MCECWYFNIVRLSCTIDADAEVIHSYRHHRQHIQPLECNSSMPFSSCMRWNVQHERAHVRTLQLHIVHVNYSTPVPNVSCTCVACVYTYLFNVFVIRICAVLYTLFRVNAFAYECAYLCSIWNSLVRGILLSINERMAI